MPGVYVLVGPSKEGELPTIYVGEGDPVTERLKSHQQKKDFWTWVVFFVARDGTLKIHQTCRKSSASSPNTAKPGAQDQTGSGLPQLAEADVADVQSFLGDMRSILPLVGLSVFEGAPDARSPRSALKISGRGVAAKGHESADGFVVLKDSEAAAAEVPSVPAWISGLRKELREQEVLVPAGEKWVFAQDYLFNSPSTAGSVILGRNTNGRTMWKDGKGRTLKAIQESSTD